MMPVATPDLTVSQQGHYAGGVTRLVALIIDQTVAAMILAISFKLAEGAIDLIVEGEYHLDLPGWLAAGISAFWFFLYYSYCWAASGKTIGSALLGLRVVARDGSPAGPRRAVLRTLALPLSVATFGVGFLIALVQRERRTLQDLIGGTAVVYDWDARSARLRFLAAQRDQVAAASTAAPNADAAASD